MTPSNSRANGLVVLVHGLFLNGWEMVLLGKRIERAGYRVARFSYPSVRDTPREAASGLRRLVERMGASTVHFVCHSLGGLVIQHYFAMVADNQLTEKRHGRVVTIGSPHRGSAVARRLRRRRLGRVLLGQSDVEGVSGGAPGWRGVVDLGVIAGTLSVGIGRFVVELDRPNDGTVAVSETRLEGAADHISLPSSHMGLLLSAEVSRQTIYFLNHGRFDHAD